MLLSLRLKFTCVIMGHTSVDFNLFKKHPNEQSASASSVSNCSLQMFCSYPTIHNGGRLDIRDEKSSRTNGIFQLIRSQNKVLHH